MIKQKKEMDFPELLLSEVYTSGNVAFGYT